MASIILPYVTERFGKGKTFRDTIGYFLPAYIAIGLYWFFFRIEFDPTVLIFFGIVVGLVFNALNASRFFVKRYSNKYHERHLNFYQMLGIYLYDYIDEYAFLELENDPAYLEEHYYYEGYKSIFTYLWLSIISLFGISLIISILQFVGPYSNISIFQDVEVGVFQELSISIIVVIILGVFSLGLFMGILNMIDKDAYLYVKSLNKYVENYKKTKKERVTTSKLGNSELDKLQDKLSSEIETINNILKISKKNKKNFNEKSFKKLEEEKKNELYEKEKQLMEVQAIIHARTIKKLNEVNEFIERYKKYFEKFSDKIPDEIYKKYEQLKIFVNDLKKQIEDGNYSNWKKIFDIFDYRTKEEIKNSLLEIVLQKSGKNEEENKR